MDTKQTRGVHTHTQTLMCIKINKSLKEIDSENKHQTINQDES